MKHLLILIAAAALALTGCNPPQDAPKDGSTGTTGSANAGGSGERIKIGFVVKSKTEPWFQMEFRFADEAAKELGFDLIKLEAKDASEVDTALDNLGAQGAKGVIICSPNVGLGTRIVEKATEHHMNLMSVDDRLEGADKKPLTDVHHLGIKAYDIGKTVGTAIAAEMTKRGWKPEETGAIILTVDELQTARERIQGAMDSLTEAKFPAANFFKVAWKPQDIAAATDAAGTVLTQHSNIKRWVAFSSNDDGVLGAVRATEAAQIKAEDMIGVGINGTSGVDDFRKSEPTGFFASVLLSPRKHGYDTAKAMFEWCKNGVEPQKEIWTSGILIDRTNYQEKMKAEGLE